MRERVRRDEGQVLGLALVFLVFVALVLAATLTAAAANLHATQTLTQQRDERYAAEAGILAAAGTMQANQSQVLLGTDPGTGPSIPGCGFQSGPDFVNSMAVDVSCTPHTGSGAGTDATNRPPYSVLALASGAGPTGNEGVIPVNVPNLQVFGPVGSKGACNLPTGLPTCDMTSPADPGQAGLDPRYAPDSPSAPTPTDPVPSCDASTATFSPGTYTSPPSITGCNKPWWFTKGDYYFDFTNNGSHVWTINNTVVGGVTTGWDTAGQAPTLPGSCKTEQNLDAKYGVQFVFGGDSRMQVGPTGAVELCAKPSSSQQQIAVYGMTPDLLGHPLPTDQSLDPDPRTATTNNVPPYVSYNNARKGAVVGDNQEAQASIPAGGAASINVGGFRPLPDGSIIERAEVDVVHHEDPALQPPLALALRLDANDGTTLIGSRTVDPDPSCNLSGECTTPLVLDPQFFTDPTLISRLDVTFTATAPGGGGPYNSAIDGIVLNLQVDMPTTGYRPLVGCTQVTLGPQSDPQQPCPVLSTVSGAQLYVQGTVYAPTGGLNVNGNTDDPVRFNRGIIARTVVFRPGNGGAPDGVTAGGAFNRWVVLNASANGTLRIATTVTFDDVQAFIDKRPPAIIYNSWDVQ